MTERSVIEPGVPAEKERPVWLYFLVIGIAALVMYGVFSDRFGQNPRLVESPLIGQPLPEMTLEYLEQDGSLDFADLKGQALVINFWASWCFPCRAEHPVLNTGSAAYADEGVHFVGIVYQDRREKAVGFLDEFGRGTNYSYVMDGDSRAIIELGVFGVPETYFVDKDGIIRDRHQGEIDAAELASGIAKALAPLTP